MILSACGTRIFLRKLHWFRLLKLCCLIFVPLLLITLIANFYVPYHGNDYLWSQEPSDYLNEFKNKRATTKKPLDSNSVNAYQEQLNYIGLNLGVHIQPITNENYRFYYNIILTNNGNEVIDRCCWKIYFYSSKMLDYTSMTMNSMLKASFEMDAERLAFVKKKKKLDQNPFEFDESKAFIVSHVIGYTFSMEPSVSFQPLFPRQKIVVRVVGQGWSVSVGEFLPNWYVANPSYPEVSPRLLVSTVGEDMNFVGRFSMKGSVVRFPEDRFKPFTPRERFVKNDMSETMLDPIAIIPRPFSVTINNEEESGKEVIINDQWEIVYEKILEKEAIYLHEKLRLSKTPRKLLLDVENDPEKQHNKIVLRLAEDADRERIVSKIDHTAQLKKIDPKDGFFLRDAYEVSVDSDVVRIYGLNPSGVFYAVVSVAAIFKDAKECNNGGSGGKWCAMKCKVVDAPRFRHRGLMVDVARNFQPVEELKKLVNVMATYKMNVLHLHLSDDEGWRLEIPDLPELTKIGGRRGHDPSENDFVMSLLGSGPFPDLNSGSGHYGVGEFRDFLKFATERYVMIIPEFDMPSHSHAAIVSMKARYKAALKSGKGKTVNPHSDFLLSDLQDNSMYLTGQFYSSSAINPCLRSTYRFVKHILKKLVIIYQGVAPLKYFHLGGDEVPGDAYSASPACESLKSKLAKKKGLSYSSSSSSSSHDLKIYFVEKVAGMAAHFNLSLIGWEDAFSRGDGSFMTLNDLDSSKIKKVQKVMRENKMDEKSEERREIVAQYYYNSWEQGLASRPYSMANKGMKVILSPITALYFDSPQEPDPFDWGLHWGSRYTDTRRAFHLTPNDLFNSIDYTFNGQPINRDMICMQHFCEKLLKPQNVLGIEAVMWSELIRTPERMHAMLFPRLLAVAERAWHRAGWEDVADDGLLRRNLRKKDWDRFASIVGHKELEALEAMKVSYYLPRPGVTFREGRLLANTMFPGLKMQMSEDGGVTWRNFQSGEIWKRDDEAVLLISTISYDGSRRSTPVRIRVKGGQRVMTIKNADSSAIEFNNINNNNNVLRNYSSVMN